MPIKTKSYKDWLGAKLADPVRAARYLNAARQDSPAMFFKALRKVASAQSRPMTELAETVGVSRESLYRMMSETGNPSHENVSGILDAMGFKIEIVPLVAERSAVSEGGISEVEHPVARRASGPGLKGFSFGPHYGIAEKAMTYWPETNPSSNATAHLIIYAPAAVGMFAYPNDNIVSGNTAPGRDLPDMSFVLAKLSAQNISEQERFNHGKY